MQEERGKETAGEIVVQNKFVKWLDNFWYHNKWPVIIIGFFVVVLGVCLTQCATRKEVELPIVYAGGYYQSTDEKTSWSAEERAAVEGVLISLLEEKGLDSKGVGFLTYSIYTEKELKGMATEPPSPEAPDGKYSPYAFGLLVQSNTDQYNTFARYYSTGECTLLFVSEYVYNEKKMAGEFVNEQKKKESDLLPLSEIFETVPDSAHGEYAIRLGDTELYRYYDALKVMPADTLVVLRRPWVTTNESMHANYEALFRAIVEFEAP